MGSWGPPSCPARWVAGPTLAPFRELTRPRLLRVVSGQPWVRSKARGRAAKYPASGQRCQAPDRAAHGEAGPGCVPAPVPPQPQPCPLCLHLARDFLPSPSPPQPHPRCTHPPSCCSGLPGPLQSCAEAPANRGGLGQDQRDRGHLPDLNRAQDLRDSLSTWEASAGCSLQWGYLTSSGPGEPPAWHQVIGQAGVGPLQVCRCGVCRCAGAGEGVQVWRRCRCGAVWVWSCAGVGCAGVELCRCAGAKEWTCQGRGAEAGKDTRGPPARPRQLAPGTLCCTPGPPAPLWGSFGFFPLAQVSHRPLACWAFRRKLQAVQSRALCRPRVAGLDTEQWQGL